jgi:GNAT superfamily N-acetyltransferase
MPTDDSLSERAQLGARQVTEAEADRVTELFALAFYADPVWSWAFPAGEERIEHHRVWWGLYVRNAVRQGRVWTTDDGGAAAVWIPPGGSELSDDDQANVEPLLRRLLGSHASDVLTLLHSFDANHPQHPPHYYLSLLGTHPDHRGHGKGMGLVATALERIDELGMPAFLESSNPANDPRYERLGFVRIGEFAAPSDGPTVTCMWRDVR